MPGLLIIAHAPLASSLKTVAEHTFPDCGTQLAALDVRPDMPLEQVEARARELLAQVRNPQALILTDVFGATPANVAQRIAEDGSQVKVIAGVNVPMLWRTLCYAEPSLDAMVARAIAGATQGVMQVASSRPQNQTAKPGGMVKTSVTISNRLGLHARASAKLTKLAGSFASEVHMSRNGRRVNAKSIMGVMMLAAGLGSEVEIETEGADETAALAAITALIQDKFGEGE